MHSLKKKPIFALVFDCRGLLIDGVTNWPIGW